MKLNTAIIAVCSMLTLLGSRPLIQAESFEMDGGLIPDVNRSVIHFWPSGESFMIMFVTDKETGISLLGECFVPADKSKSSFKGMSIVKKGTNLQKTATIFDKDHAACMGPEEWLLHPGTKIKTKTKMETKMESELKWCFQQVYDAKGRHSCLDQYYIKVETEGERDKLLTLPALKTVRELRIEAKNELDSNENNEGDRKTGVSHDDE